MTNNNTQFEFEIFHSSFRDAKNRIGFLWDLSQHKNINNFEVNFIENDDFGTTYAKGIVMEENDDEDKYRAIPTNKMDFIKEWSKLGCPLFYTVFSADNDDFKRVTLSDAETLDSVDFDEEEGIDTIMLTYYFSDRPLRRKMNTAIKECLKKIEDSSWYEAD